MLESVIPAALAAVAAVSYGFGVRVLRRRPAGAALAGRRPTYFFAGLAVMLAVLTGPVDSLSDVYLSVHMVQHIALTMVAAPLLALGTPVTVAVIALPARWRRRATTLLRGRAARIVLAPSVGWAAFMIVLLGSHLPSIYDAALRHQAVHDLEHLAYLVTGVLFWSAIVGRDLGPARASYPSRLLYLFLTMGAMALLGMAIDSAGHPIYPYYTSADAAAEVSAIADQRTAAAIMWNSGMITAVPAMGLVVLAWMVDDERRVVREERRHAASQS